jgi:hypothetical protein
MGLITYRDFNTDEARKCMYFDYYKPRDVAADKIPYQGSRLRSY